MADTAAHAIEEALCVAVSDAIALFPQTCVSALSGGVDSAFVAAIAHLPAVTAGFAGSHDLLAAQKAADALHLPLTVHELKETEIIEALAKVVPVLPDPTAMNAEIALSEYFIFRTAHACGASAVLTGQGADELFAGYDRYGRSVHLREDLDHDYAIYYLQQERDYSVATLWHIEILQPFMDPRVVAAARTLQQEDLVDGNLRKVALRRAAESCLPHDLAWLPKKAMQYGTGVAKIIDRHARKERLTVQEYIEQFR
ncbi:MAG TPA: asparagine synthase C-terminal domain-containing protein [Methanocorpusculum sp.]|nr:asparagine synthase C-terminal domain-containing protein [Methanocorpusculum sp.]